jgi:VWFA-related protein
VHHAHHVSPRAFVLLASALLLAGASQPQAQEPRFRGGANLVRLDVYASVDGAALTDLTAEDFEVLEDNAPQTVSSFEFVRARGPAPAAARTESNTVAEMRSRAAQPDARAFVLFLDTLHVQVEGSYHAANPVAGLLERVIGADDLIGVMTPEMSARNMTFSPRTGPVGDLLRANWTWGERGAVAPTDSRENDLRLCYPDVAGSAGIAKAVIERRREQKVLRALEDLITHLEGLRDERTFVLLLSEGWTLPRADEQLAAPVRDRAGQPTGQLPGGPEPVGVTSSGRLGTAGAGGSLLQSCERERSLIALSDLEMEFQQLMQRANRANVSFYPIDPRGLVVFDDPIGPARPAPPALDRDRLTARQNALRRVADETDGVVVLNTAIDKALPRLMTDIGSYYLLGYVSTNTKLDGRYRRLTVRVKRPGVTVRARPGYLAPSAAEVAAAQPPAAAGGGHATAGSASASVTDALSRLPVSRRPPAIHLQASGAPQGLVVTVELDRVTAALPDWAKGGRLAVAVEPADRGAGARANATATLAAGSRVGTVRLPEGDGGALPPGRYQGRFEALADGARTPVVVSTTVDVPGGTALLGSALLATRRGPGTGRNFEPTADPRFRRIERLQAEVARIDAAAVVTGRLLNRAGQVMQVPVAISERPAADALPATVVAEIALAPLAAGEYVLELTATSGERSESRTYAIRMVP